MFLRAASALESRGAQGLESLAGKRREVCIPAAGPAAGVGPAHGEPGPGSPGENDAAPHKLSPRSLPPSLPGTDLRSCSRPARPRQLEKELRAKSWKEKLFFARFTSDPSAGTGRWYCCISKR